MKGTDPRALALLKYEYEKLSDTPRNPPQGYIYVPKGDVYITRNCRKLTSEQGQIVYVVYNNFTFKVMGLHVPKAVYEEVKEMAALTATARQTAVLRKDQREMDNARELIVRLFPRMPPDSVEACLARAFEKGSGRVGRSRTIDDDHKVKMAVLAHIRHIHTPYDTLLKKTSREEARKQVWPTVTAAAKSWGNPSKKELQAAFMKRADTAEIDGKSDQPNDDDDDDDDGDEESDDVEEVSEGEWAKAAAAASSSSSSSSSSSLSKPPPQSRSQSSQSFERNRTLGGRVNKSRSAAASNPASLTTTRRIMNTAPPSKNAVDPKVLDEAVKFVRRRENVPLGKMTEAEKHQLRISRRQMQKAGILY